MIEAIKEGNAARVLELIREDKRSATAESGQLSPLMTALYHGKQDIVNLLLQHEVPLSFWEACATGKIDLVDAMVKGDPGLANTNAPDGFTPLALAIFFGQPAVARLLIERGADVNAQAENAQHVGAIHAAVARQDQEILSLLLQRGADPNRTQQLGFTALHGTAGAGNRLLSELLISHGADRKAKSDDGKVPADLAREKGHLDLADWLDAG